MGADSSKIPSASQNFFASWRRVLYARPVFTGGARGLGARGVEKNTNQSGTEVSFEGMGFMAGSSLGARRLGVAPALERLVYYTVGLNAKMDLERTMIGTRFRKGIVVGAAVLVAGVAFSTTALAEHWPERLWA